MTPGEYLITGFVITIFILGIYAGLRLYKWNRNDMRKKLEKNIEKKKNKNTLTHVWKKQYARNDG